MFFYSNGSAPASFGRGVRAEVPVNCPSSNCTWPEFETLAICSKCTEVSNLLRFACINTTLDWVQIPDAKPDTGETIFLNGTSCGWWINADTNNPLLMTGYNVDNGTAHSGEVLLVRAQPIIDLFTRGSLQGYSPRLNSSRNPISHVVIVSGESAALIHQNKTPIAHECLISWCIEYMLSESSEGGYSEKVKSSFSNSTLGPDPWDRSPIYDDNGQVAGVDFTYNENVVLRGSSGKTYEIDNNTQVNLITIFDDVFPSTYTLINSTNEADAMLRFKQYVTISSHIRSVLYLPWLFANITTHLNHMSSAMTNIMRSSADRTEMIEGSAFDRETFIQVRWAWLSFPFILLFLGFLFLVSTIIRSSTQEDIEILKISAVAALLYGLPDDIQKEIIALKGDKTALAHAKDTKIRWSRTAWRHSGHVNTTLSQAP
jgi:hypothetical protein